MILIGQHITEGLTPAHKVAFVNSTQKKIREYEIKEVGKTDMKLYSECSVIIGICYELLGQPAPGENQEEKDKNLYTSSQLLYDELTKYFSTYSMAEVQEALRMGLCGNLGKIESLSFPSVSVANISKIIHVYNEKVRRPAIFEQNKLQEENDKILRYEENERKNKESNELIAKNINAVYAYFLEHGEIPLVNGIEITVHERSMWYRFLDKLKLVGLPLDHKKQIRILAEERLKEDESFSKQDKAVYLKEEHKKEWEEHKEYLITENARAIALLNVFIEAKKEGKENIL